MNQSGVLRVEATAVGEATTLARMARMVEEAQGSKAPMQKLVDQVAAVFVPVVIVIAAGGSLGWGFARRRLDDGMLTARSRCCVHRVPVRARAGDADRDHGGHRASAPSAAF